MNSRLKNQMLHGIKGFHNYIKVIKFNFISSSLFSFSEQQSKLCCAQHVSRSVIHQMSLLDFRSRRSSTGTTAKILREPQALKMINGLDVYRDTLPRQSVYGSLSTIDAAPQTLDTERIFITSSMHIHGQVDGACGGMCMSSQHSAECRSRRQMLIQLYGSCSLVPMATVFALEQKSYISYPAINNHCQA